MRQPLVTQRLRLKVDSPSNNELSLKIETTTQRLMKHTHVEVNQPRFGDLADGFKRPAIANREAKAKEKLS